MKNTNSIGKMFAPFEDGVGFIKLALGKSEQELISEGVPATEAGHIAKLCALYHGHTTFTRKQAHARAGGHAYAVLKVIENYAARLKEEHLKWRLREHMATCEGNLSKLRKIASEFVKELQPPAPPTPGVARTIHKGTGMRSVRFTGTDAQIADIETLVDKQRPTRRLSRKEQLDAKKRELESFVENIKRGGAGFAVHTVATIHLDDLLATLAGKSKDMAIPCSNGADLDIEDYLSRYCAEQSFVAVFTDAGPLKLARASRLGNHAQRLVAKAETSTCASKDCTVPADECQLHHITDYQHGGPTDSANLTWLCRHHNGANGQEGRGRIERVDGQVAWVAPWGGPPHFTGRKVVAHAV
ncbi:HNH endonuclease signature motif containing protein [Corynebacterium phocae]|nr:HNH endonuclease signature motif containing protein [Corynebacterium phocae]